MLYDYERVKAMQLAEQLGKAFIWANTRDGDMFWHDVQDRLKRISKEGF